MFKRVLSLFVIICFFLTSLGPLPKVHADTVLGLPQPGVMINLSPAYEPVIIKGLTVHKDNPFLFDFIVDVGQDNMSGEPLKKEGEKLIKYFLASLAIPDKDLWVNLSPYEKNRIVPEALGQTDMGRDLLEQDYILKQITASMIYPEKQLGKTFWDTVYAKAQQMYGTTQVPVNTFNKVWIMADKAEVFEHNQTAFVVGSHLKVMLEEDYLALNRHSEGVHSTTEESKGVLISFANAQDDKAHSIASQIIRQIVLPELEKEVNTGKNFANLRQIFNSVILSSWYKKNLKEALLNQVYADHSKIKGINLNDPTIKEQIYQQYLKAYKKGVFNYIKEEDIQGQTFPRKYFSGGTVLDITPKVIRDPVLGGREMAQNSRFNKDVDIQAGINFGFTPSMSARNVNKSMLTPLMASVISKIFNRGDKKQGPAAKEVVSADDAKIAAVTKEIIERFIKRNELDDIYSSVSISVSNKGSFVNRGDGNPIIVGIDRQPKVEELVSLIIGLLPQIERQTVGVKEVLEHSLRRVYQDNNIQTGKERFSPRYLTMYRYKTTQDEQLSAVAKRSRVSMEELAGDNSFIITKRENDITLPQDTEIWIRRARELTYVIQENDSLDKIANYLDVSWKRLVRDNQVLSSVGPNDKLQAGLELKVNTNTAMANSLKREKVVAVFDENLTIVVESTDGPRSRRVTFATKNRHGKWIQCFMLRPENEKLQRTADSIVRYLRMLKRNNKKKLIEWMKRRKILLTRYDIPKLLYIANRGTIGLSDFEYDQLPYLILPLNNQAMANEKKEQKGEPKYSYEGGHENVGPPGGAYSTEHREKPSEFREDDVPTIRDDGAKVEGPEHHVPTGTDVIRENDNAMGGNGGIDLNTSSNTQWKVSNDGKGVEMNVNPAMLARIQRDGIDWAAPEIFKVTPIANIWALVRN